MRKFYALATMAILMPFLALAQFSISGKVVNQVNKQALAGASVKINGRTTQTDKNGLFAINDLKALNYQLTVSFLGYKTHSETISLNSDKSLDIELSASGYVTDEVIVRATRAAASSPTTYKNISREELEKNNLGQDLPYLLNQTPSVVVSSDAGTGIGYTGIRIRGSDPTRVNVTINGIPYNDPESQGTFWVNLPDFASSVDNIQIQRGVGTSTNGAGAFGGSLNIQTTTRRDSAYVELNSSGGSFGTLKNTLNFGTGTVNEKFTFDGRLSRIVSDGYIDRGSSKLYSYFASGAYYGKNSLIRANVFSGDEKTYQVWNGVPEAKLKGDHDALLAHYYNNYDYLYYNAQDSVNLWDSDRRTYSQFLYNDQTDNYKQTHYQLLYNRHLNTDLSFNTAFHYTRGEGYFEEFKDKQRFEKYGLNPVDFGAVAKQKTPIVRRRWLDNDFYGITYALNYTPASSFDVTFGGAYNEYNGDHFGEIIAAPALNQFSRNDRYYTGNGFKKDLNFYIRTSFTAGKARFYSDFQYRYVDYAITGTDKNLVNHDERYNLEFFNPKVGINYQLNKRSQLYASLAIANKEPNRDDYINQIAGKTPKSENLKNIEAGYIFNGKSVRLGANLYGMYYKDQLVLTGRINDVGEPIRQNVANSYRAGLELDGSWRISKAFYWNATATLSDNKIKDFTEIITVYDDNFDVAGEQANLYKKPHIAYSPSFIASSELSYSPFKNADIALLSKYVGKQYLDNTSNESRRLDAFLINDLRLRYSTRFLAAKNIGITLLVNNLFSEVYESNGYTYSSLFTTNLVTENFYFPQAGRNFLIGVNLKF